MLRGFEDTKDEISSSLEASDIFGLIFYLLNEGVQFQMRACSFR